MKLKILIYIGVICLLSSCSLFDNDDPIPAFLIMDNPTVEMNGVPVTHNVKDVWVFDGGTFLGIFPLPAKVPVIIDGNEKLITVFAGVRNNGGIGNALKYPFYDPVEVNVNLTAQEELSVPINFTYSDITKFDFIEEFEGSHIFVVDPNEEDGSGTEISIQSDMVCSGLSSGNIHFDADTSSFERTTLNTYDRANNLGSYTFIELDYKCDIPFLAGWITYQGNFIQRDYEVIIAPRDEWNKIYIDITQPISDVDIDRYSISFASTVTTSPDSLPVDIYLDNIKLVHF